MAPVVMLLLPLCLMLSPSLAQEQGSCSYPQYLKFTQQHTACKLASDQCIFYKVTLLSVGCCLATHATLTC